MSEKTKVIIMRHGETDYTAENKVLGNKNVPLNENGEKEAAKVAKKLAEEDVDLIYVSPLERARKTGEIVAAKQEKNCTSMEMDCLREQDFGVFEGKSRDDAGYQAAKREFFKRYEGGESFADVVARVYPFLDMVLEKHEGKTILIVAHKGVCRVIANYFEDMENEEFATFDMEPCEYKIFEA